MELWDILDENGNKTGKTVERGKLLKQDEYHLVVFAWIRNSKGEFLISKRTPNKTSPNMWEITAGAAIMGEDSLSAVLREVREELGIKLDRGSGKFLMRLRYQATHSYFADIWIFEQDIDISNLIYQPEEVCDAKWSTKEKIQIMIQQNQFTKHDFISECLSLLE